MRFLLSTVVILICLSCEEGQQERIPNVKPFLDEFLTNQEEFNECENFQINTAVQTWFFKGHWSQKEIVFHRVQQFKEIPERATVIEFKTLDSIQCYVNYDMECAMGMVIYDSINWRQNKAHVELTVGGVRIGYSTFLDDYKFDYIQIDSVTYKLESTS